MKQILRTLCIGVFISGTSAVVLLFVFFLIQQMIMTELLSLEVLALVLLVCLALAFVAGCIFFFKSGECNTFFCAGRADRRLQQ